MKIHNIKGISVSSESKRLVVKRKKKCKCEKCNKNNSQYHTK